MSGGKHQSDGRKPTGFHHRDGAATSGASGQALEVTRSIRRDSRPPRARRRSQPTTAHAGRPQSRKEQEELRTRRHTRGQHRTKRTNRGRYRAATTAEPAHRMGTARPTGARAQDSRARASAPKPRGPSKIHDRDACPDSTPDTTDEPSIEASVSGRHDAKDAW